MEEKKMNMPKDYPSALRELAKAEEEKTRLTEETQTLMGNLEPLVRKTVINVLRECIGKMYPSEMRETETETPKEGMNELSLREIREKAGWTIRRVAYTLDVADNSVTAWELGSNGITKAHVTRLAELYGVQEEDIRRASQKARETRNAEKAK